MPSRPDLREISTNVKEAFADADRETLLEVLTFVLKEYVVEGPPPMLVHQAEQLSDLKGASFAQLITAMQTRFDHPELAMFVVDGDTVSVRVGGVVQPLLAQRQPLAAPLPPVAPAAEAPRVPAGVRMIDTTVAPARPAAPPPSRGLSVREAPTPAPAAAAAPPAPTPAPAPVEKTEKPESGDDAATRFGLLELD